MKTIYFSRILLSLSLFSAITSLTAQNTSAPLKNTAYTITVPGKVLQNGNYSPSRIIQIEQLAKEDYLPNTIYLKLNSAAKDKLLPGNSVQSDPLIIAMNNFKAAEISNMISGISLPASSDIYGVGRIYEISYLADIDPYEVCKQLINNPDVEYAVPVFKRYFDAFTPNDPQLGNQWALTKIQAREAWDFSKGDTSVVIAIVDGGTDWQHTDLSANIWNNYREIPGNGIDDDTSGKIDDIHGWDFVGNVTASDVQTGNWKEDNNPKNPVEGHGTHTAGIASAVTDNATGIASIGFKCKIMPVKCGSDLSSVAGIYRGYTAILYAANMGADIISCSWGGPGFNPAEEDMIAQVTAMGSLVVAASGNNGQNTDIYPSYPGAYENVMNVGSTASDDKFAATSNFGSKVTVYAPGENIFSTYLNNTYLAQSGTSMACPMAAGLAGLVRSIHPDWTPLQIRQQLRVSCDNVLGSADQSSRYLYWGRINAYKALHYNSFIPADVLPGFSVLSVSLSGSGVITNYNPVDISISLTNYLTMVDSVKVSIQPLSKFVSVSKNEFWIKNLATFDTAILNLKVQLLSNNPWFKGNAELQITYSSPGYTDIQRILVPIDITSNNFFRNIGSINSLTYPQWHGASSPDENTCWGVGSSDVYGCLYFRKSYMGFTANRVISGAAYITDPVYCIHAFNENIAVAGTGKGYLLRSVNGGTNWSKITTSTITGFANAIIFKDQDTGMLLGDPMAGRWGIGISNDKGQNWSLLNNVPAPLTGETGYVESVSQRDENVWFGTSQGRIFFTPDFGKTWKTSTVYAGGMIIHMAFYDSLNGIAAYTESSGTAQTVYLANTTDGGVNWNKKVMNLTENGLYPLSFYHLPKTRKILAVFTNGYVMITGDLGITWKPVLSQEFTTYDAVEPLVFEKNVKVWEAGDYINTLEFNYEYDSGFTALSPIHSINPEVNVFPVPSSDILHIAVTMPKNEYTEIQLVDITGRIVKHIYNGVSKGGFSDFTVSVNDIAPALYFVRIHNPTATTTMRVVISR